MKQNRRFHFSTRETQCYFQAFRTRVIFLIYKLSLFVPNPSVLLRLLSPLPTPFFPLVPLSLVVHIKKKKLSAVLVQVRDLSWLLPIGEPLGTGKDAESFSARPCQMTGIALTCIAQTEAGCSTVFFILSETRDVH